MKLINYLIGGGLVAVLVAGAVLAVNMNSTITGDRATDKACQAMAEHFLEAGDVNQTSIMRQLAPGRVDELIESVTEHSAASSFPEVRAAGEKLAIAGTVDGGLFGALGVMEAAADMAYACKSAGWDAHKAGIAPAGGGAK